MVVHIDPDDGQVRFEPAYSDSFEGALERLLWIVAEAQREPLATSAPWVRR